MTILKRRTVDTGFVERRIMQGALKSAKYLEGLKSIYRDEFIQSDAVRRVISLCLKFYSQYQDAPGKQIWDLLKAEDLKPEDEELIRELLEGIELEVDPQFNHQYLLDLTEEYFRRRSLEVVLERGRNLLAIGRVDKAEQLITSYRTTQVVISNWTDPFSTDEIREYLLSEEEDELFRFPGVAGELLGGFQRDWLVGWMAPMKRGKSWFLLETAVQALEERLRVVFVSLEMNKRQVLDRLYRRLIGFAKSDEEVEYPVFSCQRVAEGTCPFGKKADLCDDCRGSEEWMPEVKLVSRRPAVVLDELKGVKKKLNAFSRMFGKKNLRIIVYPAFTAGVDDLVRDLDSLEYAEGFVPDVVVIDYADILRPGSGRDRREQIDEIWKRLKSLAGERHCLVVTASQSNRPSISKRILEAQDVAEDIGKIAHCDVMIGINQTSDERKKKLVRLNLIVHRHKEIEDEEVVVLQCLKLGQPMLDSERASLVKY